MRIMVTGAAGLYGVHLVDLLLSQPGIEKVIGVDNFSRQFATPDPFLPNPNFGSHFELWRTNYQDLTPRMINDSGIDALVHLAAFVSIDESMEYPEKYFENNEHGSLILARNLLETVRKPLLVVASSPEVYGNPSYTPMDEDHPMYPRSFYAVSKLAAEKHCRVLYEWYGYPVVVIRNFNTYGPNQNIWGYSAVIPAFIERALHGKPLVVYGDGRQTRDFVYVKDAVRAYLAVIRAGNRLSGGVFNIGTGKQTPIADLAHMIQDLTESHLPVSHQTGRPGDLDALSADIGRARRVLHWSPVHSLNDGLKETIEWYRGVLA